MGLIVRLNIILFLSFLIASFNAYSSATTCGDARSVKSNEAKRALHDLAQKRAQKQVEKLVGKKLVNPYINNGIVGKPKTLDTTMPFIEIFWCYGSSMPLHSAYLNLYTSDELGALNFFGKRL